MPCLVLLGVVLVVVERCVAAAEEGRKKEEYEEVGEGRRKQPGQTLFARFK